MTALLGVEGAKGSNGAPAMGQVTGVLVDERNCGWAEIKGRACKYGCKVAPKAGAIPVKK
jgi:hypothetical protein